MSLRDMDEFGYQHLVCERLNDVRQTYEMLGYYFDQGDVEAYACGYINEIWPDHNLDWTADQVKEGIGYFAQDM